jgi:hypothetical protein
VAISTAIGKILVFDPSQSTLEETIDFSSGKLALTSDGAVLGASASSNSGWGTGPTGTLNFYSLPSGNVLSSFPSNASANTVLSDFTLAASGTTIGQVTETWSGSYSYARQVTPIAGGSVIWSDTGDSNHILLSPDGTLVAEYNVWASDLSATNIFKNGTLVTAIPGAAVGWLDNNRILVNQYALVKEGMVYWPLYTGCTIYSSAGVQLATTSLPELQSIETVDSGSVYDPASNTIYSLTTGQPVWKGSYPNAYPSLSIGAVAGPYVVYESGHSVVVEAP